MQLNIETINPKHNQMFLFHSETGLDKLDALVKMWEYVQNYQEETHSFTHSMGGTR